MDAATKRMAERIAERKRLGMTAEEFDKHCRGLVAQADHVAREHIHMTLFWAVHGNAKQSGHEAAKAVEAQAKRDEAKEYARKYGVHAR